MGKKRTNRSLKERRGAVSHASKDGTALVCKKGAGQAMGNHQPLYFSLFFSSSRYFGMKQEPRSIHTLGYSPRFSTPKPGGHSECGMQNSISE